MSATRFGIMKGTFDEGLPSACSNRPNGSLREMRKLCASRALISATTAIICWPSESRTAQRLIEATQSSAVTG